MSRDDVNRLKDNNENGSEEGDEDDLIGGLGKSKTKKMF
jgi:hypothetical protein